MNVPPYVNGVSPCEGQPGTKIKIWGENLGLSESDVVSIKICGHECIDSMDWVSDRKIICESGEGIGRGRIIVNTLSGGIGSCSVYFTGLEKLSPGSPTLDPFQESEVWMEENWDMFNSADMGALNIASDTAKTRPTDPLGLNTIGTSKRASDEIIQQFCPNGSGNLLSESFNPVVFLLENHCSTTYNQLKQGLENLKAEVEKSEHAPGEFIRDNLESFIQCYDTLSDVNELLIRNEAESESGSITDKMEVLLRDTTLEADSLFQGLLSRKGKADTTRNALTVLQRYRFLFNLPQSIEKNIKNYEYEIVTNDYERAKSLFAGTKVKVFSKVLKEVENLVSRFRSDLRKQLLQNPNTLENQKKLIKYLLDLDYMGDPSWECIQSMHQWIFNLLLDTKSHYLATEYTESELLDVPLSGHGHSRTLSSSSGSSFYGNRSHGKTPDIDSRGTDSKPKRILFIEKLIETVRTTLPHLFKLGQAYFNQALFPNVLNENQDNIISENLHTKKTEFNEMIQEISEVYTDLINCSLFADASDYLPPDRVKKLGEWRPFEDDLRESGAWLPLCVRKIRDCLGLLHGLNLPDVPTKLIQQLSLNACTLTADTLFYRTARDIGGLHEREDWRVQDEEGCVITSLPVLFENIVVDVLLTLKEVIIETHPGENVEERKQLMSASVEHFQGLLEDFSSCLSYLAFGSEEDGENPRNIARQETVLSISEDTLNLPSPEEQLLLILSNSYYTREYVVPRLFDCFISHGYPECPDIQAKFLQQLVELDKQVFERYIELKVEPLCSLVAPGMHGGYFNWKTESLPTDIRSYIKEILIYFVHVHAEVSSISEHITKRVLSQLLEKLSSEMLSQLRSVKSFSDQGKLVGYIEVLVVYETLNPYITQSIDNNFREIFELVESIKKKYSKKIRDITESFEEHSSLQFRCFKPSDKK